MARGVKIGLRDVHYAILDNDEVDVEVTYEAPQRIIGATTANVNPNPSTETLFADDGPMEVATTIGDVELELEMAEIPLPIQAILLGHTWNDVDKQIERKAGDVPPWVAVGFKSLKSNGNYRYMWLLKGRFMVPEQSHETKGDTVTFQPEGMNAAFVRRDFDDVYQIEADEDEDGFDASDWFTTNRIDAN